jgi:hypothetical protein
MFGTLRMLLVTQSFAGKHFYAFDLETFAFI